MSRKSLKIVSNADMNKVVNSKWFKEHNGGLKCHRCGYDTCEKALEFHHLDPTQKTGTLDSFARWLYRKPEWFQAKIRTTLYVLLCANCHRELHAGLWKIDTQPDRHPYDSVPDDPAIALWCKGRYGR